MSRSAEGQGHNDACLWKGLVLSNTGCEYEVNHLTNENVIGGKRNGISPIYKPKLFFEHSS